VAKHLQVEDTNADHLILIFDLQRAKEDYIPYGTIEQLKNGIFFSGKYEASTHVINSPHVICFANYPPDKYKLSADRWNIIEIE
jgi:hypothetical protein